MASQARGDWPAAPIKICVNVVGRLDEGQPGCAGWPVDE